ncbi:glycerol-3-phosphate acyltransferase [Terribacillus saccharophilus]|jgi:acyl phosphate:glycerol-3-phosphate acyltransferase|uniref:Glycerol-3-phosphate acyltransferase n=1 Tax=Terribacillus saccharophilus TaxID=361277 RepID=A0A268HD49_9BACI|nr:MULTISPECIES: glycerol-3-phosphate 1-O-acyltransferase PlsY [Terribacillus]PAD36616.1 glycerol-3-phosphate acyltransferase [Terribacillus saccharophilus]PAD97598.1 glycerol-3-phosphate acyltransferase [Terribacillus saccharophilus]PAE01645.1 glycerol-3-phosphate acyltransferase [Terribacillus saccharophilus]PAE07812.1 glycerol-3-phosphate acyltransferase [Terribacillus saccharophilus]VVM32484.1 Acyl-phosphate:glycerol-3-phosphate O-acyltransferase PlsY [Terribacillus sp. AE2B 122]
MEYVLFILLAYLIGSIPSALIVGKVGYNIDVREHGSGNLGATNTFRILGKKAGIIVLIADILKGTIATILPVLFGFDLYLLVIGLGAVIGHVYPVFARFKGGKAVATSAGIILGVNALLFAIIIASFVIVLLISKYVSLASMTAGIVGVVVSLFITQDIVLSIVLGLLAIFILYKHRQNIVRIIRREEPKASFLVKNNSK